MTGCGNGTTNGTPPPPPPPAGDITYSVTQIGGTSGTVDSTGIQFTFSADIASLNVTAADITIGGNAAKGSATFTKSGSNWLLSTINVTSAGAATVKITKTGIIAETKAVAVHKQGTPTPTLPMFWWGNYIPTGSTSVVNMITRTFDINDLVAQRDNAREFKGVGPNASKVWGIENKYSELAVKGNKVINWNHLGYLYFISPKSFGPVAITQAGININVQNTQYEVKIDGVDYYVYVATLLTNLFEATQIYTTNQ